MNYWEIKIDNEKSYDHRHLFIYLFYSFIAELEKTKVEKKIL